MSNKHIVNIGTILFRLTNVKESRWKSYDRAFLRNTVQEAMVDVLYHKEVYLIKYNGKNGEDLTFYRKVRYPADLKHHESKDVFPFPDYFLKPDSSSGGRFDNLVSFEAIGEHGNINRGDQHFELFFALQFSLLDAVNNNEYEANDFLEYHHKNSFGDDLKAFAQFIQMIIIQYSNVFKESSLMMLNTFFNTEFRTSNSLSHKTSNKEVAKASAIQKASKYNARHYALAHFYKQEAKLVPKFGIRDKAKYKEIDEAASTYGLTKSGNFRNLYHEVYKEGDRLTSKYIPWIQKAIEILQKEGHSAAIEIAQNELEKINLKS